MLPSFVKGESGPHTPSLLEKWTQPPKPYTEATLLRAMETAGKLVDDESAREALKENGIGRPSTRAAIIETLFRRKYIRKERKNLIPTDTGIELIQIIQEDLLKSAELTGQWENKLRRIEAKQYEAKQFIDELKQMLLQIVYNVRNDSSRRVISYEQTAQTEITKSTKKKATTQKSTEVKKSPKKAAPKAKPAQKEAFIPPKVCPKCQVGSILKGKTAYGCSEWKNGCDFRIPFPADQK